MTVKLVIVTAADGVTGDALTGVEGVPPPHVTDASAQTKSESVRADFMAGGASTGIDGPCAGNSHVQITEF